ncbi:MAG: response regulator [Breznakibacter sp.]|nr:response regulator [Breznakibacter sp.]
MNNRIKILYVDDEPINLQLFVLNFRKKHQVFTAEDGFKALEVLNREPGIIIVISDMKMPGMNGLEFIKMAKERFPEKKFHILTGYEITPEIQEALRTGLILKYFNKPFNIKEIETTINEAIE